MQEEHRREMETIYRTPGMKIIYALGMLSDVIDGNMIGEERNIHVNDAKEIIIGVFEESGILSSTLAKQENKREVIMPETTAKAPVCPSCGAEVTKIYTSINVSLVWKDGKWQREEEDPFENYYVECCDAELIVEELDKLGIPNELR